MQYVHIFHRDICYGCSNTKWCLALEVSVQTGDIHFPMAFCVVTLKNWSFSWMCTIAYARLFRLCSISPEAMTLIEYILMLYNPLNSVRYRTMVVFEKLFFSPSQCCHTCHYPRNGTRVAHQKRAHKSS